MAILTVVFFSLSPRRPPLCQRFVVGGKVPDNVAGTLAAILVQLFTQIVCAMEESGPKFTQPPPCQQCTFCFCVRMKLCSRGKSKKSVCVFQCECDSEEGSWLGLTVLSECLSQFKAFSQRVRLSPLNSSTV